MLVRAGDVELNPGPRQGTIDSTLEDMELVLLAKDVPGNYYSELSVGLGFSLTEVQNVLTKHLLDIPGALIELFGQWKMKQRDGTNCRTVLGEILGKANMGALQTKLLEGGYLKSDKNVPSKGKPQEAMTEEQVSQCAEDLKSFYLEQMCKIKPDPLDFNLIVQFEQLYTNLVLLRHDKGLTRDTQPLDYKNLFTTKVGEVLPKRLLVEGEGGVGKTTLCSKIAWDWAKGCEEYKQFKWVVVIPLRNVIKDQTIGDCMKYYLNENNIVSPEQIEDFMISQPSKVLIVLDGFDEYDGDLSKQDRSGISQVLRFDRFKQCTVLVTTRPWRAHQIKRNQQFGGSYAFIAVKGFSAENVSTYISKYFVKDVDAGKELIRFIEVNDVIKENMAPFPIYVAMLCILWENIDSEKLETIRRLKTFSHLFEQMIIFLIDHFVSKSKPADASCEEYKENEISHSKICLGQIGSMAFDGLLQRKMVFQVDDFGSCTDAMEICCRIGVLRKEQKQVPRSKRSMSDLQATKTNVFFSHKLFQEYVAALYLASLYEHDCDEYGRSLGKVMENNVQEFRYLLYFTASQVKEICLKLQDITRINDTFLVDVTFEAYDKDTAKAVGQRIFAEKRTLEIDNKMSAHTVSGYLFIMEQHQVETLELRIHCGPTVSRDIADLLSSPTSLITLNLLKADLDGEFYSVSKRVGANNIVQELHIADCFLDGLQKFDTTIKTIFPNLTRLRILTGHTVTPVIVERLAQASLEELSIERANDPLEGTRQFGQQTLLIGKPVLLEQLFSKSFPQLTSLVFQKLMIGNIRTTSILNSLKKHQHLKSISIIACFTDNELDPLAEEINAEKRIKVTLQHDEEQSTLNTKLSTDLLDALCHRTSVCELECMPIADDWGLYDPTLFKPTDGDGLCFPDLLDEEVDSKIRALKLYHRYISNSYAGSACKHLARLICNLPCLTNLTIMGFDQQNGDLFSELSSFAASSKIHTFQIDLRPKIPRNDQSESACNHLARFICCLPCLTNLIGMRIDLQRTDLFRILASSAKSLKIHTLDLNFQRYDFLNPPSSSACKHLASFICYLPRLTNLTITAIETLLHQDDDDDIFFHFSSMAASSKIHTLDINFIFDMQLGPSACKHLAIFLCCLPCLTNLTITGIEKQRSDFFNQLASMAASSKSPYFLEKKHLSLRCGGK